MTERSTPLVTVAIPAYNRPEATCKALESILAQEVDGLLEALVVDDVSTDGAWEAVQAFAADAAKRYPHVRLRVVQNERNVGLFGNFNRCLELAEGKYVCVLCNDDRLVAGGLRHACALLDQRPNVALVSSRGWFIDEQGQRAGTLGDFLPPGIYNGKEMVAAALWALANYGMTVFSYPSGILMRRDAVCKAGWFEVGMKHLGDMDYFLKIVQQGDMAITSQDGCEVMQHKGAMTSQLVATGQFTEEWFLMIDKWQPYLPSRRLYRYLMQQSAAFSVYFAQFFWRKKQPAAARAYWRTARKGMVSPMAWPLVAARFLSVQIPFRLRGTLRQPIAPYETL